MLIKQHLSLLRILRNTWKTDVFLVITCVISYYLHRFIVPEAIQIPPLLATLLGTAIAFFVGFNNNQAYNRWWEARTIWGGIVNDSRSWARNILNYTALGELSEQELSTIRKRLVRRQIAFVFALKENLRETNHGYYKQYLSVEEQQRVSRENNIPNAILTLQAAQLQYLSDTQSVDPFRFTQMNSLLTAMTDHLGKCERIKNTIYPTSYIYFTRLFIWVMVIFNTLILDDAIGVWSILISWIIGFVFHAAHLNGMGLVNPFEETPTAIPIHQISRNIEINLLQMLGESNVPEPVQPVNNEYLV